MKDTKINKIEDIDLLNWKEVYDLVKPIKTENRYERLLNLIGPLIDEVEKASGDPFIPVLDSLSIIIEEYEKQNIKLPDVSNIEMLQFFMDEHSLTEYDLPEIGGHILVVDVLSGKVEISNDQAVALSKKFNVSLNTFL